MSGNDKQIAHFSGLAAEAAARAANEPGSQSARFYSDAYAAYAHDARSRAALELAADQGDLFEVRLIGPSADRGSMQVHKVFKLLEPMTQGLPLAAHRLRYGQEAIKGRVNADVRGELDLRLSGVAYGSTRLMLTGNSHADTTGTRLLPSALTQLFRVLAADEEDFYDAIHAVGAQAARRFSEALKAVQQEELACEVRWHHDEEPLTWEGSPHNLGRVIKLLDTLGEPDTFQQTLTGDVNVLRSRGYFTLEQAGVRYRVAFSTKQLPEIQTLTIGKPASVVVETTKYFDRLAERDVEKHRFLGLSS